MRARTAILLALLFALISAFAVPSVAFAQDDTGAQEQQGETDSEGEGGAGDPEAETGAGGDEEAVAEEEGPPWTYQMARITLVLLLLLFLAMGLLYWRLLASRQRAAN